MSICLPNKPDLYSRKRRVVSLTAKANVTTRDTNEEKGDPAQLTAQVAKRWGQTKLKLCKVRKKMVILRQLKQPKQNKN
jgi:hypothetical protein